MPSPPSSTERSESIWKRTAAPAQRWPALTTDAECDVCVVGAGIAGLSVAYEVARRGRTVLVLDDRGVGAGESAQTTAHLASALDDRFIEIERIHGAAGARLAWASHHAAIERIEAVCVLEGIDCDLRRVDGYLVLAGRWTPEMLDEELVAARRAGFHEAERLDRLALDGVRFDGPCLRFPRQGQFHPLRYLEGLTRAIERDGGRIHVGTHASDFEVGPVIRVRTAGGAVVRCRHLVVATNSPVNDRYAIHTKQAPFRTFVVALRVPKGAVPTALFWDTREPYHYVRTQPWDESSDALLVGGEDHKTGWENDAPERYRRLELWARAHFPSAGERLLAWSGQVFEPADGMGFIGRNPADRDNVYVVTGDSGQGMTHGTIAGMLIPDLIDGLEPAYATLYDPSRRSLRAVGEYARINAAVAARFTDWLRRGDAKSIDEIAPGTGAVVTRGLSKIAVYRDEAGQLSACSAVCTHLGCIVHWNGEERSWDCPCHGSRFATDGRVLNGPALGDLERVELPGERPGGEAPAPPK
jgi:glycine/D-amino acid oxidase-like deaminating enzyme/nitrite reductase/ring-hydroxylating ferredoxin subunit